VWLDADKTSPYEFYQYWFNASDEDAENYIKIFTLKDQEEIESLITEHKEAEYLRKLQKELAADITTRVHGEEALKGAIAVTNLVFGKSSPEEVRALSVTDFEAMKGAFKYASVSRTEMEEGLGIIDVLGAKTGFLSSNGEARRELKGNSISVNKEKVKDQFAITPEVLINDKYVLLSKGKKNNYLLIIE